MGNKESNESAAVKRQAEGGAIPMYELADLSGGGILYIAAKRALVKNDTKELDELIRAKVRLQSIGIFTHHHETSVFRT